MFPRIRVENQLTLIPAGRSGVDFKLIIKTPEPNYHYTVSVGYPSSSGPWQLPIYAEKTLETRPKAHHIIGRGKVDLQGVARSLIPAALPTFRKLDPEMGASAGSEFIAFTPQLMGWFGSGEITINEDTLALFQPVSYAELRKSDFALGMPVGVTGSGLIIHTASNDYSLTFPPLDTFEERIERAATLRKVDEFIEGLEEDGGEDDW